MNALETVNLSKTYNGKKVLDGVSVCVREGDIYGLVGRNGAGKTTLIRALLGLVKPDGGEVKINGAISQSALENERKHIGSIIDSPALALHMSALDNMKAAALSFGAYDVAKLKDILRRVGLNPDDSLKVKNYSLGMKQRLAIGIALIGDPSILILDEPVNGLDPAGIFEVRELLQRLNHVEHKTILISSHLLSELGKVANSYGVIEGGKLVKELRSSDLEELCRPYIKVVVGDLKNALKVVVENYRAHDFEILPYNTLALYDMSKDISFVASMFAKANVPVLNIYSCEGDLESTFIALMGGLHGANDDSPVFDELGGANDPSPVFGELSKSGKRGENDLNYDTGAQNEQNSPLEILQKDDENSTESAPKDSASAENSTAEKLDGSTDDLNDGAHDEPKGGQDEK